MPSKFERTMLPLGASSAYVALLQREGHSLKTAPFVPKPYSMKPDRCQIKAEYKEGEKTQNWVTGPLLHQLVNLRWNTLRSSYLASTSSRFPTLPPRSAADITDLRIDMPASDGANNTPGLLNQPTAADVTFTALENLLLVGFGRKLHLLPFHWSTSCPSLVDLRLEGGHSVADVHAILLGCPKLEDLTVSTITGRGHWQVASKLIKHDSLINLTLVSNIPVGSMLGALRLTQLEVLNLWVMPDVACHMIKGVDPLFPTIAGGRSWTLGLNFDIPENVVSKLDKKRITYTRLE